MGSLSQRGSLPLLQLAAPWGLLTSDPAVTEAREIWGSGQGNEQSTQGLQDCSGPDLIDSLNLLSSPAHTCPTDGWWPRAWAAPAVSHWEAWGQSLDLSEHPFPHPYRGMWKVREEAPMWLPWEGAPGRTHAPVPQQGHSAGPVTAAGWQYHDRGQHSAASTQCYFCSPGWGTGRGA